MRVELVHRLEHLPRLLGAGGGVEVRERLAVEDLLEVGEVGADLLRVELRLRRDSHRSLYGIDGARAGPRPRGRPSPRPGHGVLRVTLGACSDAAGSDDARPSARERVEAHTSPRALDRVA